MGRREDEPRPLYSETAEQSVLGALLIDNDGWDALQGMVSQETFYLGPHQLIFGAISRQISQHLSADVLTIGEELKSRGQLDAAGGFMYLHELAEGTPSAARIVRYATIVRDLAQFRRLLNFSKQLEAKVTEASGADSAMIAEYAHTQLIAITESATGQRGTLRPMSVAIGEMMEHLDAATTQVKERGISGTSTGYDRLDRFLGGLKPGQLIVVAGRPGMGKTALAVNIAENVAIAQGLPCAVFSMEMGQAEVAGRVISSLTRIHGLRLSHGTMNNEEFDRVAAVLPQALKAPIHICEDGGLTITELAAGVRRFKRQMGNLGVIVVDYFGLMKVERPSSNHSQDLGQISTGIKALAKEVKTPILLLAQLNREVEKRQNKRPILSDLRDSGSLEQDADIVLMLYRDSVYHDDADAKDAEILIRKQRNGPVGRVNLEYDAACTRFRNPGAAT